ncbi:50S ribosomal protein L10 [Buchnera aphidicola]|uniref:Large ribosomal subunit protein uL10 n=1 Tax=Buchnera aphidicola subsp. Tuberolachnus salignus TaxID=98804 RepID=A0A160SYB9_BUCTT|nr:50S ribosomal protein L10 [Buchnera aphidicola]CUR53011.1 50S ribosomal protein L10 [Buchnera aphidicola (Tuberolachnus salignus)]
MVLKLDQKKKIVQKYNKIAKKALSIIIADISKLKVNEINYLRKKTRKKNIQISVIQNSLLKKSLISTPFEKLNNILKGSNLIAFSMEHPGSASRIFLKYQKKNLNFVIKTAFFEKKILSNSEILKLSLMPTYPEALQQFLFLLQEISIRKLLRIFLSILQQKKIKKK